LKRFFALKSRDVVVVASLAMFLAQLDAAVVTIALPAIARDFAVPAVAMSLAVTIYLGMIVAVLPFSGWAADRFGARRLFLCSAAGFAVFSLVCALAPGFWGFMLARALQGACAALIAPVARLILLRRTPRDEMVDALAITAMPMLVAPTLGPAVGGLIVEFGHWKYVFLLDAAIAALLVLISITRLPEMAPASHRPLDWRGASLLCGALIAVLAGIDRLGANSGHLGPWLLLATGAVLALLTKRHLSRHPHPAVALEAMRDPHFRTTVTGAGAVIRVPGRALLFVLPLMLQAGLGYPPFVAGLMLLALNGGDLVSKPLVRPMYDRWGFRRSILLGSLTGLVGMGLVALGSIGAQSLLLIIVGLLLAGISRSIVFTGMSSLTFTSLDDVDMTSGNIVASISMQMFNALAVSGTALALSVIAGLFGRIEPSALDYRLVLGALIAVGLLATYRLHTQLPTRLSR
jgi:MFS family permease